MKIRTKEEVEKIVKTLCDELSKPEYCKVDLSSLTNENWANAWKEMGDTCTEAYNESLEKGVPEATVQTVIVTLLFNRKAEIVGKIQEKAKFN